jgi:hypothetical protein
MKKLVLALAFLLPVAASGSALADLLTFDDLQPPNDQGSPLPTIYHGLKWGNFFFVDSSLREKEEPGTGYKHGTISPNNVALNGFGNPASFTSVGGTAFILDSFYLTGAFNNDLDVTVTASRLGVVLDTTTLIVSTTGPTLETLNWTGIDTLQFSSSGGTPHNGVFQGTQFALDNLTIDESAPSPVPEPQTLVLVGSGALAVLGAARRRLRV